MRADIRSRKTTPLEPLVVAQRREQDGELVLELVQFVNLRVVEIRRLEDEAGWDRTRSTDCPAGSAVQDPWNG